jgi:chromosomal replication initiator protein
MSTLWDQTLAELRHDLSSQDYVAWISCLRMAPEGSDALTVEAPSAFHRNWVQKHFLERIRSTVASVAGRPVPVVVAVGAPPMMAAVGAVAANAPRPRESGNGAAPATPPLSFETFVVGSCNELAHAAARSVAEAPGRQFNPLVIHGGVGLGKTHLLNAVAHAIRARFRGYRVLSIGAEAFINEMVTAVRRQQMDAFHARYRRIDTLIVDDVQFIAGKERTQEEFLHTFNLLCAAGKQIVLSSDRAPRDIPQLEQGLRSRFEGGMIAEVTVPDSETRRRILERKAALAGFTLPEPVLAFLATRVRAISVRELEGALTRIRAVASLTTRPVDLALAEELIGPLYPETRDRVSVERVESLVCAQLAVEASQLAAGRSSRAVLARQIAMFLLKKLVGLSLAVIGERYKRDHTTVLHAVRVIETRRTCDPEVRRLVGALEEKL